MLAHIDCRKLYKTNRKNAHKYYLVKLFQSNNIVIKIGVYIIVYAALLTSKINIVSISKTTLIRKSVLFKIYKCMYT